MGMRRLDFWRADWFLGVIVALVVLAFPGRDLIQSLERKAYDLGVQATTRVPSDRVAVIAIDDSSIANIGRWPWSREIHARIVDALAGAKAKVIVNSTFFFEPQVDAGLGYIGKLLELYRNIPQSGTVPPGYPQLGELLAEAEQALATDRKLDTAFDSFRKLPLDDGVMDLLYNLALDFERKRQFNKAESVFRYIADYNPKFRDLPTRLNRVKAMSETVMLGGGGGHPGGTLILPGGGVEKPMLGRYQVEKELGKGAMGVVYQGKDPKIANEPHAEIRTHNPQLPACVAAIVNKALAKDPNQRYQDGEQMAKALQLCLHSLPGTRKAVQPVPAIGA